MPVGYKDPNVILAELIVTRQQNDAAVLIVEGDTDFRFWSIWKNVECEVVDAEGKNNVLGAVKLATNSQICGVLGIVDRDYDQLFGSVNYDDNILVIDGNDLECMLCQSSALEKVLTQYGDLGRIKTICNNFGDDFLRALLARANSFGMLRSILIFFELNFDSSSINVPRFFDEDKWNVKCAELIQSIERSLASFPQVIESTQLEELIDNLPDMDDWTFVRGHDLMDILRIGLKYSFGTSSFNLGTASLTKHLCVAMHTEDFKLTNIFGEIVEWERLNIPYRILRDLP